MPLLIDSGVLYAIHDRRDHWHQRCVTLIEETAESLLVPVTVLPEVTYLLRERLGIHAERAFVRALGSELMVEPVSDLDIRRSEVLLAHYSEIGFVDATVVAVAERLGLGAVATTDRRHFSMVRPRHVPAFELLPA